MGNLAHNRLLHVSTLAALALATVGAIPQEVSAFSLSFVDNAPSVASGKWAPVVDAENPAAGLYVLGIGNSYQLYDASGYMITGFPHGDTAGVAWGVGHRYTLGAVNPSVDGSITSVDFTLTTRKGSYDGEASAFFLIQNGKYYRTEFFQQLPGTLTPEEFVIGSGLTAASFGEFVGKAYDYGTPANGSANFASNPDFSTSGGTIQFGYLAHFDSSLGSGFAGGVAYQMTKNWSAVFNFGAVAVGWAINGSGDWNSNSNWTSGVPNGVDAVANFGSAINSPQTVYTNLEVTVGALRFDNPSSYQITGQGTLNIEVSSGSGSIDVVQGNHKINLPLVIRDNTTAFLSAGTSLKISDPMTLMNGAVLTKTGSGTLTFESTVSTITAGTLAAAGGVVNALMDLGGNTSVHVSSGTVNLSGAQHLAAVAVSGGRLVVGPAADSLVVSQSLSVSGDGKVDLGSNSMVIDYSSPAPSPIDEVRAKLQSGYAGGAWTGNGILSSDAAGSVAGARTAVGYGEASAVLGAGGGVFQGQAVDGTAVLLKYTWVGDANLDGQVDITDLAALATAWQSGGRWGNGDFDYSGFVDITDLAGLATNWQAGVGASLGQAFDEALALVGLGGMIVPEPVGLTILAMAAALTRRRRDR